MKRRTCLQCVRGSLSSYISECVECIRNDKPGNSFPNFEAKDEETEELDNGV